MDFYMRLPRDTKEFALFMFIVSVISVNILAPLITCFELGFSFAVWGRVLRVIPFIWMSVVALVLLTYKPAEWLTYRIVKKGDSFRAVMLASIVSSVLLMSVFLPVIGTWIGSRSFSVEPIRMFFHKWPRNFALSLGVEALVAQPIARQVLLRLHLRKDARASL
ncbi:MAG TPA: hypothetical protein PK179_01380 [Spirochaetales bacterium]|nr:hypothetical protein [Spirochaetales bacterium]HPM72060.1 hypothetical protein [Spirochaetales bacterium]